MCTSSKWGNWGFFETISIWLKINALHATTLKTYAPFYWKKKFCNAQIVLNIFLHQVIKKITCKYLYGQNCVIFSEILLTLIYFLYSIFVIFSGDIFGYNQVLNELYLKKLYSRDYRVKVVLICICDIKQETTQLHT